MDKWYVAYLRSCQEKTVAAALDKRGISNYLPIRKEWRKWSDRKVLKDKILIPRTIFIYCDEKKRRSLFGDVPYLVSFMMDRVSHRPVVIPDLQMENFRRFVTGSPNDVRMAAGRFAVGEKVRIIDGPLKNMECEVLTIDNKSFVSVNVGILGSAITQIDASSLEKIN